MRYFTHRSWYIARFKNNFLDEYRKVPFFIFYVLLQVSYTDIM